MAKPPKKRVKKITNVDIQRRNVSNITNICYQRLKFIGDCFHEPRAMGIQRLWTDLRGAFHELGMETFLRHLARDMDWSLTVSSYFKDKDDPERIHCVQSTADFDQMFGDGIKDVEISRNGTIHNTGSSCRFDYYGEKTISICSNHRVDNGFFMGSRPIPFIKTRTGLLANGVEFEYDKFKKFIDDCLWQLKPRSNSEESSSSGFRFCPPNRIGEEDTNGNILSALNAIAMGGNPSVGEDPSSYRQIDPKLTLVNGQIALLAEQIFSRLRLYRELSAIL